MTTGLKHKLKIILPIALGVFLVWYSYTNTTPENRSQIVFYIKEADPLYVFLSVLMGILGHVSRAIRWNYLLEPLGYKPRIKNNILIILTSYFANLGIPRTGEVLRATALTTYENVPFEKGFGTIVTERVIDVIMLLAIVLITFLLQTDIIMSMLIERGINFTGILLLLGAGILSFGIFILFIKKSSTSIAKKIKMFVKGLLDGVFSIFKMKHKWLFIFHTLFIWACYIGMFWVIKFTLPETLHLSLGQLMVAFIAGSFAMATTNGGIGLYPIAVSSALAIYGISAVSGDAFGWIIWIAQTMMIVVFGAISFLLLPLLNRNK
ncbi:lysylphosphatidylglycerol synthase transmembrane domain-containing protein [Maribacter confluentis]|uniref:Lysylphosphatidylglycerol synthase transmembrane domain-containing protein n=1 Tax=Maribacter confluentis TaxID=1656093 RepID=A0ABT8RP04_9FLAO|nr:lysylphosphatidylglycerol synthase transmembrane domain-containing protein [Maribacter confluentis]MDO1512619.1 lysylphosphatidylglycerol synthase transmembrane domain-containing protein [Maribacter confluentis]